MSEDEREHQGNVYQQIYDLVRQIPPGRVSSYGRIAFLLGRPGSARLVGYALHALRADGQDSIPWWRVVNAAGRISNPYEAQLQRARLEAEGVRFSSSGTIDLARYLWEA
jgi:methylated-DNA-protein-cysteine methyltransferase related protein